MTRDEFTKLFSKEMRARDYAISDCWVSGISFHHRTKYRRDKYILRYEGKKDINTKEWIPSGYEGEEKYFKFQVQGYETYQMDWDFDAHFTPMNYVIGKTDMRKFVDEVIEAVGEYYQDE